MVKIGLDVRFYSYFCPQKSKDEVQIYHNPYRTNCPLDDSMRRKNRFTKKSDYDERNGRMTFSIYKQKKEDGEYPKKILVVDCKNCEVVDVVDVRCSERMKREAQLGILGSVNSLPHGDSVIYNFPASAEVFVYNRKDKALPERLFPLFVSHRTFR